MLKPSKKKLYCFVDETGQDIGSDFFIVVSIVTEAELLGLKTELLNLEEETKIGLKKWHKSRSPKREEFLRLVVNRSLAAGEVYYGQYKKPLPFFLPMLETITKALEATNKKSHEVIVYVDGIDIQKARELTNALRLKGIKLPHVRSARDESEVLIRLADRWAGCIRASIENNAQSREVVSQAVNKNYLKLV